MSYNVEKLKKDFPYENRPSILSTIDENDYYKYIGCSYIKEQNPIVIEKIKKGVEVLLNVPQSTGLIIYGRGGISKTFNVEQTLKDNNKEEEQDYYIIGGKATSKELYQTFYKHNGKIIVLDDSDDIIKNKTNVSFLKNGFNTSPNRKMQYLTSQAMAVPNEFTVTSKVIVITNLEETKFDQALLTRFIPVDATVTDEDIFSYIKQNIRSIEKDIPLYDKYVVLQSLYFRYKNGLINKPIQIRLFINALYSYVFCKEKGIENWESMIF